MLVAVIGGGPSGIMAAYAAAENGADVTLYEGNEKLGKKLFISGKGRCNLTNNSDISVHIANVVNNPRFLYSAYKALSPRELMDMVSSTGTLLKTERGDRVFPVSDKSSDILTALKRLLNYYPIDIRLNSKVKTVKKVGDGFSVETADTRETYDKVIICTGGCTYQATGSTGDGYRFAKTLGHAVSELRPALVGLRAAIPMELAGLSLKNVTLTVKAGEKKTTEEFGEMLFTHNGISGPIVLTVSSKINKMDVTKLSFLLDLKPALHEEVLDARFCREFSAAPNKILRNILPSLMPKSLISYYLTESSVNPDIPCNAIRKEQRKILVDTMKNLPIRVIGFEEFNGAIVTSGGVEVTEINPKDMQSKIVPGLYFAGEVLDVDALTGGFNLQIAFSTGYLAGMSSAKS